MRADPVRTIRRILVALDASPSSLAALEAAVTLAGRMQAEILGLFVEDVELLRTAESPYAREILYPSAQEAPVSRLSMESTLRTQAEQARSSLTRAAQRANVPCSFRCVRGQVTAELLAAAARTDLIALGKLGWSLGARFRIGSTALGLAESALPVLLLPEHWTPAALQFLVYYDGSAEARRALSWAGQLAEIDAGTLTVLLTTKSPDEARAMQDEVEDILEGSHLAVRFQRIDPEDRAGLLRLLREAGSAIFVLGGKEPFGKLPLLQAVLRESTAAVLLLRDQEP
jgi:nucleotide-binding universal stress UspA family protein